jgi:hypothetical protein
MAEFHEIGSSQFTDVTPTGEEKIQISASQRTTLQNIANLAPAKGVKQVVVTNFQTNTWKLRDGGNVSFPTDIKVGEIVTFTSAQDAVKGPGVELFGYAIKHNSMMASYVGMTTSNKVNGIPTIYTYKSAGAYATAWQQLPDASVKTVEITDFAIPGLNITKDGESFLFYANDASNIPNSNHGATSFVGVAIASPIFITGDQRLLYYMMVDTASGMFYTGRANLEDDIVAWNTTPVTRLGQAVQVTAFTEPALSALLYSYKPGDFIPFFTNSVTASEANQFPESGIFNGFISMGSNEGDYFQIFAFKTGSTKAYLGACIGSTTQWTALEGGGAAEPIVVADAESVATVVAAAFPKFEYGKMLPIYIGPGSDIYDYISITASHITVEESTVCGYAQCVYDGGDYYYIGVDLLVYPGGGVVPLYRAQMVINNSGEVVDSSTFPLGIYTAPIPGYTKVNDGYIDCSLVNGSTTVVSLTRSVPANTTCFIEADVQTSVTGGTVKTSSALMFFRLASGSTMCDINSRALGGTNIGQVKLNVATVNNQTSFVIITTSYGLDSSVSGGIIRIKNIYAKL